MKKFMVLKEEEYTQFLMDLFEVENIQVIDYEKIVKKYYCILSEIIEEEMTESKMEETICVNQSFYDLLQNIYFDIPFKTPYEKQIIYTMDVKQLEQEMDLIKCRADEEEIEAFEKGLKIREHLLIVYLKFIAEMMESKIKGIVPTQLCNQFIDIYYWTKYLDSEFPKKKIFH